MRLFPITHSNSENKSHGYKTATGSVDEIYSAEDSMSVTGNVKQEIIEFVIRFLLLVCEKLNP